MSIEGIPLNLLDGIGVVGVVVLVFIANVRGWIVTKREADRIDSLRQQQIAEKDRQIEHLSEVGELLRDVLRALKRVSGERS